MRRGEDDAPPSSLDPEVQARVERRRLAAGCWEAAHQALAFARRYRFEEGPRGEREKACVSQALEWRRAAHDALAGRPVARRPGLAQTRPSAPPAATSKRTA